MCDETLSAFTPESDSCRSDSPRQLIESIIELLRNADVSPAKIDLLLKELTRSLERCFDARKADDTYEAAILRAPWLSSELEQLNQQRSSLRQSLQAMRLLASQCDDSVELTGKLAQQFNDFTELYLDHEGAECNFLDSAYPGPDWVQ